MMTWPNGDEKRDSKTTECGLLCADKLADERDYFVIDPSRTKKNKAEVGVGLHPLDKTITTG